jgi:small-conductance mechanosensitive channel
MSHDAQMIRQILLQNSLNDWLEAALAFLLTFTVLPLLRRVLGGRRVQHAERGLPTALALAVYLLERTSRVVLWIVALWAAEKILILPTHLDHVFDAAIVLGCALQAGMWASAAARFGLQRQLARTTDPALTGTMDILLFVLYAVIWTVVVLLALSNLGINITALVAGLGIGGIAVALAMQTILGDLFASLSIALDRPFVLGDSLRVDSFEGTVEQIGIKSTRLRSVSGEQIIITNSDLLKSRVRNLGRATERRALFSLALSYQMRSALLEQVPQLVAAAVAGYPGTRFVHCLLGELGESALLYEVCFFVAIRPDRDEPTQALDQVNREILRRFADAGLEFAYPTRTVFTHAASSTASPSP